MGFRTASGRACVLDAHCPHLGAHLGDGRVQGEQLQCPFHGWRWDGEGRCRHVPFADAPLDVRAGAYPVVERNGIVWLWHDTAGRAPWFDVPEVPETSSPGWKRGPVHRAVVRANIRDPRENAVDVSHAPVLHANTIAPVDGHIGEIRGWTEHAAEHRLTFELVAPQLIGGRPRDTTLGFDLTGPGHLVMRTDLPTDVLFLVPNTPVDDEHIVFTMQSWVRRSRVPFVDSVLARLAMRMLVKGLREDYAIFARKRYVARPPLSSADGPIHEMRRWLARFDP